MIKKLFVVLYPTFVLFFIHFYIKQDELSMAFCSFIIVILVLSYPKIVRAESLEKDNNYLKRQVHFLINGDVMKEEKE